MNKLLSVKKAIEIMLENVKLKTSETINLEDANGRIIAQELIAKRTQPPFNASAMDGYAVKQNDIKIGIFTLKCVGESRAGYGYKGKIKRGETIRIFTGAPMPKNADVVIIQENTQAKGNVITINNKNKKIEKYVRNIGADFKKGEKLINKNEKINDATMTLAAAMNYRKIKVRKKPLVAVISTGDELVMPGEKIKNDQIVASNIYGVAALIQNAGGEVINIGIAKDNMKSLNQKFNEAKKRKVDVIATLGGASVGEHDLVKKCLEMRGVKMKFWKIAMKPGKPLMFGNDAKCKYIGLPGNPVSSLVCCQIFINAIVKKMLGQKTQPDIIEAIVEIDIKQNGNRQQYMRAQSKIINDKRYVKPFKKQDSSMLSLYHKADCLIIRPVNAPKLKAGQKCKIINLRAI